MQTFLPYPSFAQSAAALDDRRLHNQLNEFRVLRKAILGGPKTPWAHHPAAIMWHGHLGALCLYAIVIAETMEYRGMTVDLGEILSYARETDDTRRPRWFGDPEFHELHSQNLVRKDPAHYAGLAKQPSDVYIWPLEVSPGCWYMRRKQVGAKKYEDHPRILMQGN